jgi:hypothetical protein
LILCSCFVFIVRVNTLATFPYVVVRVACCFCKRSGTYRLARLAEKFGADATVDDVLRQLAADCPHWKRNARWKEGCGVYLPDLDWPPRPRDMPRPKLRVVK